MTLITSPSAVLIHTAQVQMVSGFPGAASGVVRVASHEKLNVCNPSFRNLQVTQCSAFGFLACDIAGTILQGLQVGGGGLHVSANCVVFQWVPLCRLSP